MSDEVISEKKRAMFAYKEKLLSEINIYKKRIEEVRFSKNQFYFNEDDSSDSEVDLTTLLPAGPSTKQLNSLEMHLSVCLQATQELTSLQIMESEVNLLVDPPVIENSKSLLVGGTWREVLGECRVDLVPFSITFLVHQPNHTFASLSYHNLRVTPVKAAHEKELSQSVLVEVKRPSDAVQVLKSYSAAHRSRRTSLARLAEKYTRGLHMEPLAEGGYLLRVVNLLEVSWSLQNKWSPIAPFHHRMKFDLEFMDENYIKQIKHFHKQLLDPTLETDERTYLLGKIIDICLVVGGDSLVEESETDTDVQTPKKVNRHISFDEEPDMPHHTNKIKESNMQSNCKVKDSEVMAPPKQLPKKVKAKGKENVKNPDIARKSDAKRSLHIISEKTDNYQKNVDTLSDLKSKKNKMMKPTRSDDVVGKSDDLMSMKTDVQARKNNTDDKSKDNRVKNNKINTDTKNEAKISLHNGKKDIADNKNENHTKLYSKEKNNASKRPLQTDDTKSSENNKVEVPSKKLKQNQNELKTLESNNHINGNTEKFIKRTNVTENSEVINKKPNLDNIDQRAKMSDNNLKPKVNPADKPHSDTNITEKKVKPTEKVLKSNAAHNGQHLLKENKYNELLSKQEKSKTAMTAKNKEEVKKSQDGTDGVTVDQVTSDNMMSVRIGEKKAITRKVTKFLSKKHKKIESGKEKIMKDMPTKNNKPVQKSKEINKVSAEKPTAGGSTGIQHGTKLGDMQKYKAKLNNQQNEKVSGKEKRNKVVPSKNKELVKKSKESNEDPAKQPNSENSAGIQGSAKLADLQKDAAKPSNKLIEKISKKEKNNRVITTKDKEHIEKFKEGKTVSVKKSISEEKCDQRGELTDMQNDPAKLKKTSSDKILSVTNVKLKNMPQNNENISTKTSHRAVDTKKSMPGNIPLKTLQNKPLLDPRVSSKNTEILKNQQQNYRIPPKNKQVSNEMLSKIPQIFNAQQNPIKFNNLMNPRKSLSSVKSFPGNPKVHRQQMGPGVRNSPRFKKNSMK